ncbi:MAG: glycosyltransferase, partial [Bacteroidota bacterium]
MDVSVIIVNYNVRQFLEKALNSLHRALEGLEAEVLVVDNASDDGSVEMLREKFPRVTLIANSSNAGFARANNQALKRARGRHLLLLNPDTVVQEDTVRVMLEFFARHPDAGLAGCMVLNPDGSFQLACRRSFPSPWVAFTRIAGLSALFPRSRLFGRYNLTYLDPGATYEVDAVSGSFMMISRSAYEKVGGLDETFFMYGEDLDWCYRIRQAGLKVYYVHATRIVHFKGESTRRSGMDEIRVFYGAMQVFVEKHFSRSVVVEALLTSAIQLRAGMAFAARAARALLAALPDILLVNLSLAAAEMLHFGGFLRFPPEAYPVVWTVPALITCLCMYAAGVYTTSRHSVSRTGAAVIASFVILSAIVFFAKDYAFSRAVVLISGGLSLALLPGWRLGLRLAGRGGPRKGRRPSLFGRRTLIVGTGSSAQELLRKLRDRVDGGYEVLGFIDSNRRRIGETVGGIPIVGSVETIGKAIRDHRVSDVVFASDGLSYAEMLSVIARSDRGSVDFRLVPDSLDAIVGKTRIDFLDAVPLVEIEYNIRKPLHRFLKRSTDAAVSLAVVVLCLPLLPGALRSGPGAGGWRGVLAAMPRVLAG